MNWNMSCLSCYYAVSIGNCKQLFLGQEESFVLPSGDSQKIALNGIWMARSNFKSHILETKKVCGWSTLSLKGTIII